VRVSGVSGLAGRGSRKNSYFWRPTHFRWPDRVKPPELELVSVTQSVSTAQGGKTTENSLIFGGPTIFGGL
jgi:hypothetical protein